MPGRKTVICIGCPLGCRVTVSLNKKGAIAGLKGAECKQGEKYVLKEFENPVRILTTTVPTNSEGFPLLPVRTSKPVLKRALGDVMHVTATLGVEPPVEAGQVIKRNVAGTGADLVATSDWKG